VDLNLGPAVYEFSRVGCTALRATAFVVKSTILGPKSLHRAAPRRTKTKVWTKIGTKAAVIGTKDWCKTNTPTQRGAPCL